MHISSQSFLSPSHQHARPFMYSRTPPFTRVHGSVCVLSQLAYCLDHLVVRDGFSGTKTRRRADVLLEVFYFQSSNM